MSGTRPAAFVGLLACFAMSVRAEESRLCFHSGFEPGTEIVDQTTKAADAIGVDRSLSPPNRWVNDLELSPFGNFHLRYNGGDDTMRLASIIADPQDAGNHVLRYWMARPNNRIKGRIQSVNDGGADLKAFTWSARVRFHDDWQLLVNSERQAGWFILSEYWNNPNWTGDEHPFRIHLTVDRHDRQLKLGAGGQVFKAGRWTQIWHAEPQSDISIPIGEWFTLTVYYQEGLGSQGRFRVSVVPPQGQSLTLFDVFNSTHHPEDPTPDGIGPVNLMKMYSADENIDIIRGAGGVMQIDWDDLKLWTGDAMPTE